MSHGLYITRAVYAVVILELFHGCFRQKSTRGLQRADRADVSIEVSIVSCDVCQIFSLVRGRLSLSADGDKCAMVNFFFWGGEWTKSLILNFNIQKCEFCTQI